MTERLELYRCEVCGNLVQVIIEGEGELVCCNQPMIHLEAKTQEENLTEKHVPVFINENDEDFVQIGSIPHPMLEEHYIMFVEAISKDKKCVQLKYLEPGEEPRMKLKDKKEDLSSLEYCNLHGLWRSNSD